jgi:ATP-dependent Lhr-like helicase
MYFHNTGVAESVYKTVFESLVVLSPIRRNHSVIQQRLLSMGDTAERVFGRKNFMELYAVFRSSVLYKVKTKAGYVIGTSPG